MHSKHIQRALLRQAEFKLILHIREEIACLPAVAKQEISLERIVFNRLLISSSKDRPEIKELMVLAFRYHQGIEQRRGGKQGEEDRKNAEYRAKIQTKSYLLELIRQQLEKSKEQDKENGIRQQHKFSLRTENFESNNTIQAGQVLEVVMSEVGVEESEEHSQQVLPAIVIESKIALSSEQAYSSFPIDCSYPLQNNNDSTHKEQDHPIYSPCGIFQIKPIQLIQSVLPILKQQQIYEEQKGYFRSKGHFLYGDRVRNIQDTFQIQNQLFFCIKWQERWSGECPGDSILDISTIRQYSPRLLSQFLEEKLKRMKSQ